MSSRHTFPTPARRAAIRVVLAYLALGALYITASDRVLGRVIPDVGALTLVQTYKGLGFVVLSTILLYVMVMREVRHREEAEGRLRQAQKMEAVGRLAGGVAHDFNNLMTVVVGNAEFGLQDLASDDPLRQTLEEIAQAGQSAAAVTRQLLAFSRNQQLELRAVDLNEVVGGVRTMLERLLPVGMVLSFDLHEGPIRTKCDPQQMQQVLINLAVNARDAMGGAGRLRLSTGVEELTAEQPVAAGSIALPGRYVLLQVIDGGAGMDAATMERIFEPFFTTKSAEEGTGLGLAIVLGIVQQSGGHLDVQSTPAAGTTFTIRLPAI